MTQDLILPDIELPRLHAATRLRDGRDAAVVRDAVAASIVKARDIVDRGALLGFGVAVLVDGDGRLKDVSDFANLVTTAGDQYYAQMGIALVTPIAPAQPTKVTGMKLGTGTTAVTKSGAAATLITYITNSNNPFDASYPQSSSAGGDTGWNATYRTTWAAGDVTNSAITEAIIPNDAGTDATSTAPNTISRTVWAALNKTATDSLIVTWTHKFLGA